MDVATLETTDDKPLDKDFAKQLEWFQKQADRFKAALLAQQGN